MDNILEFTQEKTVKSYAGAGTITLVDLNSMGKKGQMDNVKLDINICGDEGELEINILASNGFHHTVQIPFPHVD